MAKGFNHIGLATRKPKETIEFYVNVLGFEVVRHDRIKISEGGTCEHVFMDCGDRQLISFLCPDNIDTELQPDWDTGIGRGLGVPIGFYHFAFDCDSEETLLEKKKMLEEKGLTVSPVHDGDWCKSIYFTDPVNKLQLEYCTLMREFNEDDRTLSTRFEAPWAIFGGDGSGDSFDALIEGEASRHDVLAEQN